MQPIPVPTDNIYKFSCLFGLVLIVTSILSFVSSYSAALDRKVRYSDVVIPLQAKAERTKAEEEMLSLHQKLIAVTRKNEEVANWAISVALALGLLLSSYGATRWHRLVQVRDDQIADLQLRKLAAEVAHLEAKAKQHETPNDG